MITSISATPELWVQIHQEVCRQSLAWIIESLLCAEFGYRRRGWIDADLRLTDTTDPRVVSRLAYYLKCSTNDLVAEVIDAIRATDIWDLTLSQVYVDPQVYYFIRTQEKR